MPGGTGVLYLYGCATAADAVIAATSIAANRGMRVMFAFQCALSDRCMAAAELIPTSGFRVG
jgi:hypothetical protein